MSLDLSHSKFDDMLKRSAMDFMRGDAPKLVVEELLETETGMSDGIWKKMADLGWLGILIPEKYGGTWNAMTSAGVVLEAMGKGPLPGPYFSSAILGTAILMEAANEDQKKEILPLVSDGKIVLTLAMTEADYGWDANPFSTLAEKDGDGFVINGLKMFVHDAKAATHFIVAANTPEAANASEAASLFLIDAESEGVAIRRLPGFLSGRTFEVSFNGVKTSTSALLGNPGSGWEHLNKAIARSIPPLCAYKVGGCQSVLEMALEYSRGRVQFGQPIGRFQRVQDMIIEIVNHADAARWSTYEALWKQDTMGFDPESIHLAKTLASEGYWQSCTLGHQVFSGLSYSMEHELSFHTRTSRYLYNYFGDPGYHRRKLGKLLVP